MKVCYIGVPAADRRGRRRSHEHGRHIVQPLKSARATGSVLKHSGDACNCLQRLRKRIQQDICPGRVGLDHAGVAKPVDDDAGQTIRFGMDQVLEVYERPQGEDTVMSGEPGR